MPRMDRSGGGGKRYSALQIAVAIVALGIVVFSMAGMAGGHLLDCLVAGNHPAPSTMSLQERSVYARSGALFGAGVAALIGLPAIAVVWFHGRVKRELSERDGLEAYRRRRDAEQSAAVKENLRELSTFAPPLRN